MTELATIVAELRDRAGKGAARATRRAGLVPGVIYGGKQTPVCIALDPRVVWAEINKPGFYTKVFEIEAGNSGKHRCLARDVQLHPVTDKPLHVDFMRVSAEAVVHVKIPVHCINELASPGIKRGGVLNVVMHEVEVACRSDVIPGEIKIDLTGMEIGASVHLSDLKLPEGVTPYHTGAEATVVSIAPPTVSRQADGGTAE